VCGRPKESNKEGEKILEQNREILGKTKKLRGNLAFGKD
jgi:hypothetical protein